MSGATGATGTGARRVLVTGASGCGTTTLGRALAQAWAVPHADADDYFWEPTEPPFTHRRPAGDGVALMRRLFLPRRAWVLSGSLVGWAEPVADHLDAVVFLTAGTRERLRRLDERERRMHAGAPVDEAALREFLTWAASYDDEASRGRTRAAHERWLAARRCPVLRLDATAPAAQVAGRALDWFRGLP